MTPPRTAELLRFAPAARWVHRATAVLVGICLLTAAVLYLEPLATLVGRRALVVQLHVWAGLALPVPVLLGRLSAAYRADLRELDRWTAADRAWLRRRDRRTAGLPVGKFNAGQKLNAALSAGGGLVLLGTGIVMEYGHRWPLPLRTGATWVHDWTAAALFLLVLGHVRLAYRDEDARRGLRTGWVPVAGPAASTRPGRRQGSRAARRGRCPAWSRRTRSAYAAGPPSCPGGAVGRQRGPGGAGGGRAGRLRRAHRRAGRGAGHRAGAAHLRGRRRPQLNQTDRTLDQGMDEWAET